MCAFCRSLRRVAMKLNRLQLVGGISQLSEQRITPNTTDLMELSVDLEKLSRKLPHKTRAMLDLRAKGFDWKEIAEALQMTDTAARTAFWREVKRARSKNLGRSPREGVNDRDGTDVANALSIKVLAASRTVAQRYLDFDLFLHLNVRL